MSACMPKFLGKIPPNADLVFDVELISINGKTRADLEKFESELDKWVTKTLGSSSSLLHADRWMTFVKHGTADLQ